MTYLGSEAWCNLVVERNRDILSHFEGGLIKYRLLDFLSAKVIFDELSIPCNDGPSKLYSAKCEDYLNEPPGEGWDGVYTAKSK